jgi:hypothetical protein
MVNILFYSSCGMVLGNTYALIVCKNPIKMVCITGLVTSLLNHSLEEGKYGKQFFRTLDRNVMRAGFTIYYLYQVQYLYLLYLALSMYILSKITKNKRFHAVSHFFVTIFHHKMLLTLP